jgi:hypothetical protein
LKPTPIVLVATSGSQGPLRDAADPAPCGGSPAHAAAAELYIPDVPTAATAFAVRPVQVDAQQAQLTSATLPVGGAFYNVSGKGPGSFSEADHGFPGSQGPPSAVAVSPDLVILQEALGKAVKMLASWEQEWPILKGIPLAQRGRAESIVAHRSALAALLAWRPAIAPATTSSDDSFRSLSSEPLVSPAGSELASALAVPAFGGTHAIAAPDVCCFPAVPIVAPAPAVGPAPVDLHQAHHTLGSGDFSPSAPPVDSSRRPIGEPVAIVAPIGIVDTSWAIRAAPVLPGMLAAAASFQARFGPGGPRRREESSPSFSPPQFAAGVIVRCGKRRPRGLRPVLLRQFLLQGLLVGAALSAFGYWPVGLPPASFVPVRKALDRSDSAFLPPD